MATRPISSIIARWNQSSTLTAIGLNVKDTLSLSDSKLLNLQVNSSSKFSIDKSGVINANVITASNINISGKLTTNTLSATSFSATSLTGSLQATSVDVNKGTFTTISGSNVKVTGTLNTNALSATSFTGSLKATTVSASKGTFTKLTASFAHIGAATETSQYTFGDGTVPNLYTNKFKAHSASLTYLEFITGSTPTVRVPTSKGIPTGVSVPGNNRGLKFVGFDTWQGLGVAKGQMTLDPETASLIFDPPGGTGSLSGACAVTFGYFTNDYSAQYSPKYFESLSEAQKNRIRNKGRGMGLYSPCNNQFMMLDNDQFDINGNTVCAGITTGNRNISNTISSLFKEGVIDPEYFNEALENNVPSYVRPYLINAFSSSNNEILVKACMNLGDPGQWDVNVSWDPPGPIPKLNGRFKSEYMKGENDGCTATSFTLTGPFGIELYKEVVYSGDNCPDTGFTPGGLLGGEKNFIHKKISADGVRFVDHKNRNLYHLTQGNYDSGSLDLQYQITSSALICTKSYAQIATDMGLTLPLPTYAQVSSSVFNPNYGWWKKEIKEDWTTYGEGTDIFYVDGIDISFNELNTGSLIRGVGPDGNKLKIVSDNVTSNTFSSSNFNVSGGLVDANVVDVTSLIVNAITASSGITASAAGASSGKYAKIKIGNQTYKLLLYADS